ncbi:MAG: methyl-accepting chemotaxis protein [Lachnospiraceae bacterium]|nr:methyl-accepting chemotaxis protein [Lachnospiraceae bacterium]
MKGKLTLQQRLILPIILLGLITLLSNILAVFSIHNVNANAGIIVDKYMVSETRLEEIRHSMMNLHRLALSHIVAADHATMIKLVKEIKDEEQILDEKLTDYASFVSPEDKETYHTLLDDYDSLKHSLVFLVCASADSKTQDAYALANGDVARWSDAAEEKILTLYASVSAQANAARSRLSTVYLISLITSAATLIAGLFLVLAAFRMIQKSVITPIRDAMHTLQDSSGRIDGVVSEVRKRTGDSRNHVHKLSGLTDELSGAFEKIAGNASAIRVNASATQNDSKKMSEECAAITAYSADMRKRAEEMERSAQANKEAIFARTEEILTVLNQAIEKSRSVNQIDLLVKDILSISSSTDLIAVNASIEAARAGTSGEGFAVVAQEIRKLADSCTETANHIQQVSTVVTGAVDYLSESSRGLVDYLGKNILAQFELSVQSGQQYQKDAAYIEDSMEAFHQQTDHLKNAMDEIAASIAGISQAIDDVLPDVTDTVNSTHTLAEDIAGIAARMDTNQEIVGELHRQTEVFANL